MGWGAVAGAALGAAGSIAGGLLSNSGSGPDYAAINQANYEHQKEFAQHGIRWKVADAKAAGLHPLAALGASTASFTPSFTAGSASGQDYSWLGDAGQNIGRAVEAGMSRKERAAMQATREQATQLDLQQKQAQLDNMNLQNQSLKMDMVRQLAQDAERVTVHQQLGPGIATRADGAIIDGQPDAVSSNLFTTKPAEITRNVPGRIGTEAGTIPELGFTRTNDGGYVPVMSSDAKERLEDDSLGTWAWNIRNHLPGLWNSPTAAPPDSYLPGSSDDYYWHYKISRGAWYPVRRYRPSS